MNKRPERPLPTQLLVESERLAAAVAAAQGIALNTKETPLPRTLGRARTSAKIPLMTDAGVSLWFGPNPRRARPANKDPNGREKPRYQIPTGVGYAEYVSDITKIAINHDDPYAIARLIDVDARAARIRDALDRLSESMGVVLERAKLDEGIEIDIDASAKHVASITVTYSSPYSFDAARLVGRFDRVNVQSLAASDMGLLKRREHNADLAAIRKMFYELFGVGRTARVHPVTRADFRADNDRCKRAIAEFGEVDMDIVYGRQQPALLEFPVAGFPELAPMEEAS